MCFLLCALAIPAAALLGQAGPALANAAARIGTAAAAVMRAPQIHGLQDKVAQSKSTIAVVDAVDDAGGAVRIVASSAERLRPAQRATLVQNEVAVAGQPGVHAEVKAVEFAQRLGLEIEFVAASRPICPACQSFLAEHGLLVASGIRILE